MIFTELSEPIEAFDFRSFESLRVGISLKGLHVYTVSYWGGDENMAPLLCGFLLGVCFWLPEEISGQELSRVFPIQQDKDLSADFFGSLNDAGALARSRFKARTSY